MEYYYHKYASRIFVRQKDVYSCGPVAIINGYLWKMGNKTTKTDSEQMIDKYNKMLKLDTFQYILGTTCEDGSKIKMIEKMSKHFFNYIKINLYNDMVNYLEKGYGMIVLYALPDKCAHYLFMFQENGYIYTINNNQRKMVERYESYDEIKQFIYRYNHIYINDKEKIDNPVILVIVN